MADIAAACDTCHIDIDAEFNPGGGARNSVAITGDVLTEGPCFVADEIRFVNHGRLIFTPRKGDRKEGDYFRDYFVVCRKLVVVGGHEPGKLNPCGPDDPGTAYEGNNVITWQHRLTPASSGAAPNPFSAANGADFDRNNWSNSSNAGNNGQTGPAGTAGAAGASGGNGRQQTPNITVVALEIEVQGLGSHLTIDFDGQNGGKGGRGQDGGDGGDGMGGRDGDSDTSWPGTGCDRQPGNGGTGGAGGNGGTGGKGGNAGPGGAITMLSTSANLAGVLVGGQFSYVNDGGSRGDGGLGGFGGRGGLGGHKGFKTSECDLASDGSTGAEGWPPPGLGPGSNANEGAPGANGAAGPPVKFEPLVAGASCADLLPLPVTVDPPGLVPAHYCRGFSTLAVEDGSFNGQNLAQVTGAGTSLAGVTAVIKPSSTDTQLNLTFTMLGNSAIGAGNLVLSRAFGPDHVMAGALSVGRFEVLSIVPNTGARGTSVNVTITGTCFDVTAALQTVAVSGVGVTVLNVIVQDATTIQCVFDITNLAPQNARHVTVQTGPSTHTLLDAFTVT